MPARFRREIYVWLSFPVAQLAARQLVRAESDVPAPVDAPELLLRDALDRSHIGRARRAVDIERVDREAPIEERWCRAAIDSAVALERTLPLRLAAVRLAPAPRFCGFAVTH